MPKSILKMFNISKRFGGIQALKHVNFELARGEVHGLVGENGAGKSTLIKIISGVYQPDDGEILLDGNKVVIQNPAMSICLGISTIYQELNVVPEMSVAENIMLGREPLRKGGAIIHKERLKEISRNILKDLHLDISLNLPVKILSTAQQKMVEIARALAVDAKILIMDEPTATLSEAETSHFFKIVRSLKDRGVTIIYISHRLEEVIDICDRVTVLRNGEKIAVHNKCNLVLDTLIKNMVGQNVDNRYPKVKVNPQQVLLEVKNLKKHGCFEDISFQVRAGEVLGLAGLVGAKRTEIAMCIFGAEKYDSGEVLLEGKKVPAGDINAAMRMGIVLVPEERKIQGLVMGLSIKQNISLPILKKLTTAGIIKKYREKTLVEQIKEKLNIKASSIDTVVETLSGGNQQKVVLGKWLCQQPKVIIFDEPTRGVDVGAKIEIYNIINDMARNGTAIILISSELPEVIAMSDRLIVLNNGHITGLLDSAEATEEQTLKYAFKKGGGE